MMTSYSIRTRGNTILGSLILLLTLLTISVFAVEAAAVEHQEPILSEGSILASSRLQLELFQTGWTGIYQNIGSSSSTGFLTWNPRYQLLKNLSAGLEFGAVLPNSYGGGVLTSFPIYL